MHSEKFLIFFVLISLFSCAKEQDGNKAAPVRNDANVSDVVPDVAIVKFSKDMLDFIEGDLDSGKVVTKSAGLNSVVDELGISSMTRLFPYAGAFEDRTRAEGLNRWYRVVYSPSTTITKADECLSSLPGVEYVEEQRKIKAESGYFNDPYYGAQWNYCSPGSGKFAVGADIDVEPVWRNYTTGNPDVIVAVVDGGIDLSHEDLSANVIPGGLNGSYNFVDGSYDIVAHRHGTHVAGTIAAINNNGRGVCGIAGGNYSTGQKGVRLLSCQIFKRNPTTGKDDSADGAVAIKWGCDHGAVIANNSWGYSYDKYADAKAASTSQYIKAAIDYFVKYAGYDSVGVQTGPMAGGVVIFAAGNDGWDIAHPADYDGVIAVGSTNSQLGKSSFSNYGSWVDICAPGGYAYGNSTDIESTLPGNNYGVMAGTSMSCPHVSGVAALLVSYFGGKGFTNEKLKAMLIGGANSKSVPANLQIGPFLDAMESFNYGKLAPPAVVTSYAAVANSNNADFTFNVTSSSEGMKAYGYRLIAGQDSLAVANYGPDSPVDANILVSNVFTESKKAGEKITGEIPGLSFYKTYYVGICGYNYHKKFSALSPIRIVTTGVNHPPVITASATPPYFLKARDEKVYSFSFSDPDNHKFTTTFEGGSTAAVASFGQGGITCNVTITGRNAEAGTYTAKFVTTDAYGASTVFTFQYVIAPNQSPVVIKPIDNVILYGKGDRISFDMTEYVGDEDDDVLDYESRGNENDVVSVSVNGSVASCTTIDYGLATVTLAGIDAAGKECLLSFKVLVKNKDNLTETYPNPVRNMLYVRTEYPADTEIRLYDSSGTEIYDATSSVSGFSPAVIDMSKFSPGVYGLVVSYSGKTVKRAIIKK